MSCGFLYLVALIDWVSRAVLATATVEHKRCEFPRGGLERALLRFGKAADFQDPTSVPLSPPTLSQ